jgi:hypothetical protein
MNQFYVTLPSNSVSHQNRYKVDETEADDGPGVNTQSEFRVQLPNQIRLDGEWEVALAEIIYPHSWYNVDTEKHTDCHIFISLHHTTENKIVICAIPSGSYETTEALLEAVNHQLDQSLGIEGYFDKDVQLRYDTIKRRVDLICSDLVLKIAIGEKLRYMLGLDKQRREHWLNPRHLAAKYPVDLRGGFDALYVYCDLVSNQVVGDVLVPLLRVINIEGQHDDIVAKTYNNPHYVPVVKQEFNTIEISIKDDTNQSVRFMSGKVVVKLHFRKRKYQL